MPSHTVSFRNKSPGLSHVTPVVEPPQEPMTPWVVGSDVLHNNRHRWMPESVYCADDVKVGRQPGYQSRVQPPDLCTTDGRVTVATRVAEAQRRQMRVVVEFDGVSPLFRGFIEDVPVSFNLKSSITQLGVDAVEESIVVDAQTCSVTADVTLEALTPLGVLTLDAIRVGSIIGKVFAADPRRAITSMEYVERFKHAKDMRGRRLSVWGNFEQEGIELKMIGGRVVGLLSVKPGTVSMGAEVFGLLPTVGEALVKGADFKQLLRLHRVTNADKSRLPLPMMPLMVNATGLQMRTMWGRVVDELLPEGVKCVSSNIIEPSVSIDEEKDVRTFVFTGNSVSGKEVTHIPIEFFSSECYREHVPFNLRKTLRDKAVDPQALSRAFATAPEENDEQGRLTPTAVFVCKGSVLEKLRPDDWVATDPVKSECHAEMDDPEEKLASATRYMHEQPEYPILSAISVGDITSDGVLLTRYFPSPILKSLLLSRQVTHRLKAVVFTTVSRDYGSFFSQDDRAMLNDLATFGINVYHLEQATSTLYVYLRRRHMDCGLMVPVHQRDDFMNATFFGVYGSNLVAGDFEAELRYVMEGVLKLRESCDHPMLNPKRPLALVTGGGPGAMEVGNRVAKSLGILSCGMFVDFGALARKPGSNINEQKKNPYVEAYMTYRPEKLVERQSDFNLDFPIFLMGGIGTDFEYALEEVRRKVGTTSINPMIMFGTKDHYAHKIGQRFLENRSCGTIKGSEWISNVNYVVNSGIQALAVYKKFFNRRLPIGGEAPANGDGFVVVDDSFVAESDGQSL